MLDAEAQTRSADILQCLELRFPQSAGLAFKSDFFGVLPTHVTIEALDKVMKLFFADVRRRAASKISKTELPALKSARAAVDLVLFDQCVQIALDLGRVLIGIYLE